MQMTLGDFITLTANTYLEAKRLLKAHRCPTCYGLGKCNDMEPGDISFNEWECPDCKGTGLKGVET